MIHQLSASRLWLTKRCTWFARPELKYPEQAASSAMTFGSVAHGAIERAIRDNALPVPAYDDLDDDQVDPMDRTLAAWQAWWTAARGPLTWQPEQAVAWDVRTGKARWLPRTTHRDYGELADYEIPGTIDAMAEDALLGVVHVRDWKTGRSTVEPPSTNLQLAHNGAAAVAATGVREASVTYVKLSEEAVYVPEPFVLDVFFIEAVREELAGAIDRVAKSEPQPGPWCSWCPAKGICPATAQNVTEFVDAAAIVRDRQPVSLVVRDNDHAAAMLTALDGVEAFVSELKKALKAFADAHGGIALADGTVYSRSDVTTERPDLSVPEAHTLLLESGLEDAVKLSTSWAEIKKVGGAPLEKRVRDALRNMGAVKVSTAPRYEAKKRKA